MPTKSSRNYAEYYRQSIEDPVAFWGEAAKAIDWQTQWDHVLDYDNPPFAKWFVGGRTNLCYNAVDRWVTTQPDAPALITISTETIDGAPKEKTYSYRELHAEVQHCAAIMLSLGVRLGDRVLIYMPMIAEAVFAMLACARIGAVHSVVFGGFAANSLATRIDDAQPVLIVSADAGSRNGCPIAYKPLIDAAIALSTTPPRHTLIVDRGLVPMALVPGRDVDYACARLANFIEAGREIPIVWMESTDSSYILYTSGTTGKPKGVQRDVGGYAVALAQSMRALFSGGPGGTFFCTSDIGWVVGHSYIVYGPLIAGMATVLYEGLPTRPDAGIWWYVVEKYCVTRMFSSPTAIRVLKKQPQELITRYDLSSLQALYLAGEPLDATTSTWISTALGVPVVDNYWQTESGWPILSIMKDIEDLPTRLGSPGLPMPGYRVKILNESTGRPCPANEKGVVVIEGPLPPGCLQTLYRDDARFVQTYWSNFDNELVYSTFDWGVRDPDGYYFILGRTDDVINIAGHRLGTREIEESISTHPSVSEVAVVGVEDSLKGQVAFAFVIVKNPLSTATAVQRIGLEKEIMTVVDRRLGSVGRPARVYFVTILPKTRSGKLLRRSIQAICEGRDPGDLPTIEDATSLVAIRQALTG